MIVACKCAKFDEDSGRYECSVSGDGCMYIIPDSKRCAEDYGEGPDAFNMKEDMKTMTQERIITEIKKERIKQDEKWGEQNHHPLLWFSIIGEEYGEMLQKYNRFTVDQDPNLLDDMQHEAIQVAASCVAMLECLERVAEKGWIPE